MTLTWQMMLVLSSNQSVANTMQTIVLALFSEVMSEVRLLFSA